jgi:hypothetical protein
LKSGKEWIVASLNYLKSKDVNVLYSDNLSGFFVELIVLKVVVCPKSAAKIWEIAN